MNSNQYKKIKTLATHPEWSFHIVFCNKRKKKLFMKESTSNNISSLKKLYYEKNVFTHNDSSWILQLIAFEEYKNSHCLLYDYFQATILKDFTTKKLTLTQFKKISLSMVNSFIGFEQQHQLYQSMDSRYILINPKNYTISFISYDSLTSFYDETNIGIINSMQNHISINYFSPEQTGKTNQRIDYRSDLYSLGVLFYELLTGDMPFKADDSQNLIFDILTKKAPLLHDKRPDLPIMLSKMINKMLKKDKKARYQSAQGLKNDLEVLFKNISLDAANEKFTLGLNDTLVTSRLNKQLIGRNDEIKKFQKVLYKTANGEKQIFCVEGTSGVGKTTYIYETIYRTAMSQNMLATIKIDKLEFTLEHSLIISGTRQLLKKIFTESTDLQKWKNRFKKVDLTKSSILLETIPEIAWFIDDINPDKNDSFISSKNKNLLYSNISKIYKVLSLEKQQALLFFDDIHWASNKAIEDLLDFFSTYEIDYVCLILSYRTEEYTNKIELLNSLQQLDNSTFIRLMPLDQESILNWVKSSIQMNEASYNELVTNLFRFAKGNPLHTHNIFLSMIQNNVLQYSFVKKIWLFDSKKLASLNLSNDIRELLLEKLNHLPKEYQFVLNIASYFGNTFTLNELLYVTDIDFPRFQKILRNLIQEGYLIPLDNSYEYAETLYELNMLHTEYISFQFVHDHILHIAQNLLSDKEQQPWRYKIGLYYLINKKTDSFDDLEKITFHWNFCINLLSEKEKTSLMEWNYLLSENALNAGLFNLSYQHIMKSFSLLSENHWIDSHEKSFSIFLIRGYVEGILFNVNDAITLLDEALDYSYTLEEKLNIYFIKTRLFLDRDEAHKSIQTGIRALSLASLNIPFEPTKPQLAAEYFKTKFALNAKNIAVSKEWPQKYSNKTELILEIMIDLVSAGFLVNKNLATFLILRCVRISLKYGKTDVSGIIWNNYALILIAGFKEYEKGAKFNEISLIELPHTKDIKNLANIYLTNGSFITQWSHPFETNIQHLRQAQKYSKELSINHMLAGASSFIVAVQFVIGMPLDVVKTEIRTQKLFLQATPMSLSTNYLNEITYWIDCLQNSQREIDWAQNATTLTEDTIVYMHFSIRQLASFLLQNTEQLYFYLIECYTLEQNLTVLPVMPHTIFIQSLALFDLRSSREKQKKYSSKINIEKEIKNNLQKFKVWSDLQSSNFEHMYVLMQAEHISHNDKSKNPLHYYDHAIQLSRQHKHLQDEAICCERAANYCVFTNKMEAAQSYIMQGIAALEKWGAHNVILEWKKKYISSLGQISSNTSLITDNLNLPLINEITHLFTEEYSLDYILKNSLTLLMKKLGANTCSWYNYSNQTNDFTATIQRNSSYVCLDKVHDSFSLDNEINNTLKFVFTSKESLLINNTDEKSFSNGHEIKARSILYLPIFHKNEIAAILYFENRHIPYAFNNTSKQVIIFIANQIINLLIQNNIVTNLESIVEKRTKTLLQLNNELLESNQQMEYSKNNLQNLFKLISHDLRSPLTSVIGFTDLLLDGIIKDPVQISEYLKRSREKLLSMNEMIQDLFDLSKLETGSLQVNFETWSAQNLFFDLNRQLLFDVNQTHLNYFSEMHLEGELLIAIDVKRIEQVLMNLIQNAVKHTKEGAIFFSMIKRDTYIDFIIRDTGSGIDPKHLPFIFDVNYTKSKAISSDSSGIGLAICKQIIENHNGQFYVDCVQDVGSTFTFSIPYFI